MYTSDYSCILGLGPNLAMRDLPGDEDDSLITIEGTSGKPMEEELAATLQAKIDDIVSGSGFAGKYSSFQLDRDFAANLKGQLSHWSTTSTVDKQGRAQQGRKGRAQPWHK